MRPRRAAHHLLAAALLAGLLAILAGCNYHYMQGQALERQGRWEEAAIEYRLAVIDRPRDPDYREALERANAQVARDNYERYQDYLAEKAFRKAYDRLVAASRQDPSYEPVQEELRKWQRVLVSGQVRFDFEAVRANVQLADEIHLMARINSPNAGEVLEAEIDLDTGIFFAEDLLYDRANELSAYYTLNAIGVRLRFGRSRTRQFSTREFQRFINYRTPVLADLEGSIRLNGGASRQPVRDHRPALDGGGWLKGPHPAPSSPRYRLSVEDGRIRVASEDGRGDFTPRALYFNREDRRTLVDFGRYELTRAPDSQEWLLQRLPLGEQDYFPRFARNIALEPYFFYREGAFTFVREDTSG